MIGLILLMIACFLIANPIAIMSKPYGGNVLQATKKNSFVFFLLFVLWAMLVLFSGLRTSYNDTSTYMHAFNILDTNAISWHTIFEPYGGFNFYQMLIKKYVYDNAQMLFFISAIICNTLYLWFFAKYSKYFAWTILGYFILGPYVFSMAGMKQALAMSISLLAIDCLLRNKYLMFVLWLLIAMTFHPYIICFLILPLFRDKVWSQKMIVVIIIAVFLMMGLNTLMNLASVIGKDYTESDLTSHTINPMRVLIEAIPIVLTILYRSKLRKYDSDFFQLGLNMMIFKFVMTAAGLFYNPIYFARIGTYFSSLDAIVFPMLLILLYRESRHIRFNFLMYYCLFFVYFYISTSVMFAFSLFSDAFEHTSFISFISGWLR